jgi:2-oxoglutarate/2-oxoacid ferredoxin oxidoreductase subunit beta
MEKTKVRVDHPLDRLLRTERIPHIWCPGCGIGTAFSSTLVAMQNAGIDLQKTVMVSGIGCSGRGAGYVKLDSPITPPTGAPFPLPPA